MSDTAAPDRSKWLALALLAMAQFVVVLDASIVNVALPTIGEKLDFSRDNLTWVVNSYTLVFGGFLLLGGRLADLLGPRRMFLGGMVLFGIASLAGGFAQSELQLIVARVVQGLGAALISPAALSIVTRTFAEGKERNTALGVWGAVAGSGGAAGVLLGGVLTDFLSWRWVLFVNVPIAVAVAFAAPRLLKEFPGRKDQNFDVAGAFTITGGLALMIYALVDAESAGWGSTQTLVLIPVALALLGAFVAIELRQESPLVPFSIFRLRTLRGANIIGLLVGMGLFSMFYFITVYMQFVLGKDALETGLAYLPLALTIIFAAGAASQLVTRLGFKPTLMFGLFLVGTGLFWFSRVSADGSYVSDVLFPSIIAGAGLGFSFVPVTIAAVTGTKPDEAGLASGLINTSQQIGGALGLAILSTVATASTNDAFAGGERVQAVALTEGYRDAFLVGSVFALVAVVLCATIISSKDSREQAEAARRGEVVPVAV